MNREEAKNKVMTIYGSLSEDMKQAIDVLVDAPADTIICCSPDKVAQSFAEDVEAVKEFLPDGDCISRKAVEKITWEEPAYSDKYNVLTEVRDKVRALPPTTPDLSEYSDKLYKLAYERGKAEGLNIPEDATNGDVMNMMFSYGSYGTNGEWVHVYGVGGNGLLTFTKEWWNTPYKQEVEEQP